MFRLIGFIVAAIPVALFLKAILFPKSRKRSQALAEFKKQVDYLVWALLAVIGCALIYALAELFLR
jgi:hypothetical protein